MIRKFIELNNETISYLVDEELTNIVVLFLHGFGDEAQRALSLFKIKNRMYSITAPDMPGCGQSTNNIETPTMQYYCEIVQEFIEKTLKNKHIYVVTHSLGTAAALYNATFNEDIKFVFGVTPIMPRDESQESIKIRTKWMLPSTPEELYESQLNLFSEYDDTWIKTESVKQKILQTPPEFYIERKKRFTALANEIFETSKIKKIYGDFYNKKSNFIAIISRNDHYFDFSRAEKYINLYNINTYELNDSGHAMFYKNTDKIHKYINNFIIKKEGFY
ncbi:alpha/beta hydrolase [Mycoplasma sp. ES3157-GEN-MYC]|uniref:Alpha/beta hydrolase n=1 Tax=Mycoplasma miroungigenitalium TaxID=754515 RepID=A0A6M4JAW4_9MOLU|nr:alpha/beta hydrolase [Mycoplasma miroungigenitalium]MBU4690440.1 alpha/beta hydrolase [Mycoplasma miroungigenitalium]MBU4691707.1 alpha/beta hydrolase [Mycoplasma miroungigenitalium]QJR43535.1 alpha/beta hydrolase [Mycoplasma miroungigenitalium]